MLTMHNVTIGFNKTILLKDTSLVFDRGAIYALVAPNGYGKTTLLRALSGDRHVVLEGLISAGGTSLHYERDYLGRVYYTAGSEDELYANETGAYHVRLAAELWHSRISPTSVIERLGIEKFAGKRVKKMSSGMRQLLCIGMAIASGAEYLLLDEPMNWLDPTRRAAVSALLRNEAQSGKGIILSSHILQDLETVCDKSILIDARSKRLRVSDPIDEEIFSSFYMPWGHDCPKNP